MSNEDYTSRFIQSQEKIRHLLQKVPAGVQNWSYQRSVNFKKLVKSLDPIVKLKPSSKHVDFLKVQTAQLKLDDYYK